jgi:hypothetical protein
VKVSIWQQFSSNNSTSYTVVGVFKTAQAAQDAVNVLKGIQQQIADWHEENPEFSQVWAEGWPYPPSEVERVIGQRYGFDWQEGADWPFFVDISSLDDLVFVETKIPRPDLGPTALNLLIPKLGGSFYVDGSQYGDTIGRLRIEIMCTAPNSAVAETIVEQYVDPEFCTVMVEALDLHIIIADSYEYGGFPQILLELHDQGCTDIKVQLEQNELGEL